MKNILMIGTGGTIASGQTADGLAPELDPSRLFAGHTPGGSAVPGGLPAAVQPGQHQHPA